MLITRRADAEAGSTRKPVFSVPHRLGASPPSSRCLPEWTDLHGHARRGGIRRERPPAAWLAPGERRNACLRHRSASAALPSPPAPLPDQPERVRSTPRGGHHHGPARLPRHIGRSETWMSPPATHRLGLTPHHDGWFSTRDGGGRCGSFTRRCDGGELARRSGTTPTTSQGVAERAAAAGDDRG